MAFNGSGTFNLSDTLTAGTTATAAEVNAILSDLASGLTASLPRDGQGAMSGQFKAADGTAASPGITFNNDTNTGFYRISSDTFGIAINGTLVCTIDSGGFNLASGKTYEINSAEVGGTAIPSGTVMLFAQTAAPTGFTKVTSSVHNNNALRVVTGTASTGGSVDFTTAFASQSVAGTVGGTALTEANLPAHYHFAFNNTSDSGAFVNASNHPTWDISVGGTTDYVIGGSATTPTLGRTSSTGSGTTHTHTFTGTAINLAVKYTDIILATKD